MLAPPYERRWQTKATEQKSLDFNTEILTFDRLHYGCAETLSNYYIPPPLPHFKPLPTPFKSSNLQIMSVTSDGFHG